MGRTARMRLLHGQPVGLRTWMICETQDYLTSHLHGRDGYWRSDGRRRMTGDETSTVGDSVVRKTVSGFARLWSRATSERRNFDRVRSSV
jgi:hypothetical protein